MEELDFAVAPLALAVEQGHATRLIDLAYAAAEPFSGPRPGARFQIQYVTRNCCVAALIAVDAWLCSTSYPLHLPNTRQPVLPMPHIFMSRLR